MRERHLITICMASMSVGLVLMLAVSLSEPPTVTIKNIDRSMLGEFVSVEGVVTDVRSSNGNLFFTLNQGSYSIKAVSFRNEMDLRNRQEVLVHGEVASYKGEMELIVEKIKIS